MSNRKGRSANKKNRNQNEDHLRSQSMVPELDKEMSNLSMTETKNATNNVATKLDEASLSTASAVPHAARSKSASNSNQVNVCLTTKSNNFQIHRRPDAGGQNGRKTQLLTNFYKLDIDYSKGAYHYDVEMLYEYTKKDGTISYAKAKKDVKKYILKTKKKTI